MAYKLYMAGVLMPITPSKVTIKINNQNKTMTLIDGSEINVLKAAGLSDISFELTLPQVSYPFATGEAQSVDYYLSLFESLKTSKEPFQFILNRSKPNGESMHYTDLKVGLETYEIVDDVEDGFDTTVKIDLTQYRGFGTKTVTIADDGSASVAASSRETTNAPNDDTYTVQEGDTLWNVAKKETGDGANYEKIYNRNIDVIQTPNKLTPGKVLSMVR